VTDQAGKTIQYNYDAANQLQSVVQLNHPDPTHNTTSYGYDVDGNLTALTDANSHSTQRGYDLLNQWTSETLPSGNLTQTWSFDPGGNWKTLTDFNGRTTTFSYDTLNRLIGKTPDPNTGDPVVTFSYTATGKRATMTDASGTTTYSYDSLDRLITKATPQGTLSYTYDGTGNLASMISSNARGVSASYTWDELNRLKTVVDNNLPAGQNTTTYAYDPASNLATVTYPNGVQFTFTYDTLNRVTALNGYSYQLGPTGNRQSASEPNGRTFTWSYDGIYRLTNETIAGDPAGNNGSIGYGLDPVGNRLSQTSTLPFISSNTFSYDPNDRLASETYDNNGNTLVSGARTFAYDFENRLKSMTMNGATVTLMYDGDGNRIGKTAGGVTTLYLVDDLNTTGFSKGG
jgi:YD repeat-containing protein